MLEGRGGGAQSILILMAVAGALLAPHVSSSAPPSGNENEPPRNAELRTLEVAVGESVVRVEAKKPAPTAEEQTQNLLATFFSAKGEPAPDFGLRPPGKPLPFDDAAPGAGPVAPTFSAIVPLVVSVPDPRQSQMALYYDQVLVVLRQALAAEGYVQGHFALPWQKDTDAKSSAQKKIGSWSWDDAVPGFILFRKPRIQAQLLAILTTESPVIGAPVPQLGMALRVAKALTTGTIAVVGPFFSGSAASFVSALEKFPRDRLHLVTGSATASIDDELSKRVARFDRTVPRDDVLITLVANTLQRFDPTHRDKLRPVARLVEVGTGYGQGSMGKDGAEHDMAKDGSTPSSSARAPGLKFDLFSFPIHVSDIRAERERVHVAQPVPFSGLRRTLGLRFDASREREPDVPATLSYLTAFADDLTIGQQLLGICQQRYRFLMIQATDPLDVVYLTQETRKYCPDLTPVILGYNQLFTHPDLGSTFSGALLAAPYPPTFKLWSKPDGRTRHPFPSSVSHGFYNAVLVARGLAGELDGFECDQRECRGDVYLSQLAGGQPWPLLSEQWTVAALAGQSGNRPASERTPHPVPSPDASRARGQPIDIGTTSQARLLAWPVLLVAIFHLFARRFRRGMLTSDNGAWKAAQAVRAIVADLSLAVLVLLSCLPFLAVILLGWRSGIPRGSNPWIISIAGIVAIILLFIEALASARSSRFTPCWSPAKIANVLALGGVGLVLLGVGHWLASLDLEATAGPDPLTFVALRLLDPFRMSPAAPLVYIAAGVYVWALFALIRIGRLARFPASAPCDPSVVEESPVSKAITSLWEELSMPWSKARYSFVVVVLLSFVGWRFVERLRPSFEGPAYDRAFQMGCVVLALFLAAEAVRFLTLSNLLMDLLRELASQPMIDAYDRIARRVAGSFGLQLDARVPTPHELKISAFTCRSLANLATQPVPFQKLDLAGAAARVEASMIALDSAPHLASTQLAAHAALFDAAGRVHEGLEEIWKTRARAPDVRQAAEDLSVTELLPGGRHAKAPTPLLLMAAMPRERYIWTRMAEDFVALRISTFIYQVLHELRHTLTFVLLGALLLVASVTAYPFQPAQFLRLCSWSVVVLVVIMAFTRMLALERDEILSRLGGTRPDRIEWNAAFVQQLAIYVVLPLVGAVIGLFPGLGDALATQLSTLARILPPSG